MMTEELYKLQPFQGYRIPRVHSSEVKIKDNKEGPRILISEKVTCLTFLKVWQRCYRGEMQRLEKTRL